MISSTNLINTSRYLVKLFDCCKDINRFKRFGNIPVLDIPFKDIHRLELHAAGEPVDVSMNCTASGAGPVRGVAVKLIISECSPRKN